MATVAQVLTNLGKAFFTNRMLNNSANLPGYTAIGVGATSAGHTAAATDTALRTEVESRIAHSASATTTNVTGDTYHTTATFTASATRAVDEVGLFDAATSGNMIASATFGVITLEAGNTLTVETSTVNS